MKKIIALVVAIVMMAAMAVPAFAAFQNDVTTTVVTYGVDQTYVVVVPSAVGISRTADTDGDFVGTGTLQILEGYKIPAGQSIKVSMASNRAEEDGDVETTWYLNNADADGDDLVYTVHKTSKAGDEILRGGIALTAASSTEANLASVALYFVTEGTDLANEFSDTITFSAIVE